MALSLDLTPLDLALREPFVISRGAKTAQGVLRVRVRDAAGAAGRGEGCALLYKGETPESLAAQVEAIRPRIEAGIDRADLSTLLPPGGARAALDAALWDLEAKRAGLSPFISALGRPGAAVETAVTIGIRPLAEYTAAARSLSACPVLKIKVGPDDPIAAVAAVRQGAPAARLIVDPNQAWSLDQLEALTPSLAALGVALLEQPIPVGAEAGLDGRPRPIPIAADELVDGPADLARARGRFDVINIKLDKAGGLTAALALADAAAAQGFALMVGCMAGSSLAMAPALVLAQRCAFVDLDGPLLIAEDLPGGLAYHNGRVSPPEPAFWG